VSGADERECADDRRPVVPERLSRAFRRRTTVVAPGDWRVFDPAEWRDALVIVESGEIELHCSRGGHRSFAAGAMLCFLGLGLRALHNPGVEDTVLVAISRVTRNRANGTFEL
jgi:hypothetical protein